MSKNPSEGLLCAFMCSLVNRGACAARGVEGLMKFPKLEVLDFRGRSGNSLGKEELFPKNGKL